ncbi:helix-turn-helix transcriptional regulator [Priestia megaterium]|uniref:helix-turn-helix domain-containing protein n=1 Tax=Priestia megaterium TaxID=1404 RepID=UPI002E1F64DF|nr:helix-turn-helix transcriptional regulator [Priestia megaterium]
MISQKVEQVINDTHKGMNPIVVGTATSLKGAEVVYKIDDALKERKLTQKQLAAMTGMRIATISELVNGKGTNINYVQMLALMAALSLTSFEQIFEIRLPEEMEKQYQRESEYWKRTKEKPLSLIHLMMDNLEKRKELELSRFMQP